VDSPLTAALTHPSYIRASEQMIHGSVDTFVVRCRMHAHLCSIHNSPRRSCLWATQLNTPQHPFVFISHTLAHNANSSSWLDASSSCCCIQFIATCRLATSSVLPWFVKDPDTDDERDELLESCAEAAPPSNE